MMLGFEIGLGARLAALVAAALTGSLLLSGAGFAALAPNFQRLAELRGILEDARVTDRFDVRHPIDRIEVVRPDLYRVSGGSCHLDIVVQHSPRNPPLPGPAQNVLVPGSLICE